MTGIKAEAVHVQSDAGQFARQTNCQQVVQQVASNLSDSNTKSASGHVKQTSQPYVCEAEEREREQGEREIDRKGEKTSAAH